MSHCVTCRRVGSVAALVALGAATGLSGCGRSSRPAAAVTVFGRIGRLEVVDAFLPEPASPDVAAVYLTVVNSGSTSDALVGISTPAARTSKLMTEDDDGSVGSMGMLRELGVPAHGEASLLPGHDHVMLEDPEVALEIGRRVPLTLRFARAGALTVEVPVVPLDRMLDPSGSETTTTVAPKTGTL